MGVPIADRKPLNAVKYAAKDYGSIFDALLRRLKVVYADTYNDYASGSVGIMLTDLMAYAAGQLCWYLDRQTSDCYLETARTRAAVNRLVKQLGYKMRPASAATVDLTVTFTPALPGPGQLQAGFRFAGPAGLIFESLAPTFLPTGTTTVTVPCREGETRRIGYTGDGLQNQRYRLQGADPVGGTWVADGSVALWVDGSAWTERPFLTFVADNQFETDYLADPVQVQCGDGVAGNVPDAGADIKLQYTLIHGAAGLAQAGTIVSAVDSLAVGGVPIALGVTNALGASGGADPETADEARLLAPYAFAARGAAITAQDYQAQVNGYSDALYGRVAKGFAINPRAAAEDAELALYFEEVEATLTGYVASVTALESTVQVDAADALANNTAGLAWLGLTTTLRTATLEPAAAGVRTTAAALTATMASGLGLAAGLQTALAAVKTYTDTYHPTDTALAALVATAQGHATSITSAFATGQGQGIAIDGQGQALQAALTPVGAVGSGTASLNQYTLEATTALTDQAVILGNLATTVDPLPGLAAAMQTTADGFLTQMRAHLSVLFDADCKSNYVQVPIVSLNGDGDYVAPAAGLIRGLQTYLDGIKEVTQLVEVIDGSAFLVPVTIAVQAKVGPAYVAAEVLSDLEAAGVDLLRGRDFDNPLYYQTLRKTLADASHGTTYLDVQVTCQAYPAWVDAEYNVWPPAGYIITRGALTVTEIV
jgi:hypothetical protein